MYVLVVHKITPHECGHEIILHDSEHDKYVLIVPKIPGIFPTINAWWNSTNNT